MSVSRRYRRTWTVAVTLALAACDAEEPLAPPANEQQALSRVELLARSFALGLADDGVRQGLLADLRASRFEGHRLHLGSYLRSPEGRDLVAAAARNGALGESEIMELVTTGPELELHVPSLLDRLEWIGGPNVVVSGWDPRSSPPGGEESLPAFTVSGERASVAWTSPPEQPVIMLNPTSIDFSEAAGAPPTGVSTVGATGPTIQRPPAFTELGAAQPSSDSASAGAGPMQVWPGDGVDLGFVMGQCYMVATYPPPLDSDGDFLGDNCEFAVASAFAPQLIFHGSEFWKGREESWAAQATLIPEWGSTPAVRLIYLLSYYQDSGHQGDSEFIELWVQNVYGTRWVLRHAHLSAHYGVTEPFDRSAYHSGEQFSFPGAWLGRPYVWVAKGKHANYLTHFHCEASPGISPIGADDCDWGFTEQVAVHPDRNVGSESAFGYYGGWGRLDCTTSMLTNQAHECYWTEDLYYHPAIGYVSLSQFRGWQSSGGATAYGEVLWSLGWKSNRTANPTPNLRTWPPPPAPLNSVQILGPDWWIHEQVPPCTWYAYHEGGTSPYTYEWWWDGSPIAGGECVGDFYPGPEGAHWISLRVTDGSGDWDWVQLVVQIENF